MLKCREKNDNNKIKHFYSAAPKKIIWRLSFSLIGANGSLLDFFFFVWSPDLTWTTNTMSLSKKAQQRLHFLHRLKRASLPPPHASPHSTGAPLRVLLTSCITVWYGNASAADRKTLSGQWNTAAKIIGAPLPSILDIFLARCSAKPTASWRTPPIPPTVSSSSYHQEDGIGEPAPPDCSTAFSPRLWEPWTQITPPPSETHANPYLLKHRPPPPPNTPQPYHTKEKKLFFCCAIQVCYTQVSGPVQTTCSNTLSSMH